MSDRLRTLIVDDEPAAVRRLVRLCDALPSIDVVATASDGIEAIGILDRSAVDVLLLDIEMPGMSGISLARHLVDHDPAPAIIFVTAYEQFAIQAFAVNAIGYLLKPVDPVLLQVAIKRVARERLRPTAPASHAAVFWAPYRGTLVRLETKDIDRITGEDDYVRLHCGEKSYLVAERLYAIERRLGQRPFVRIHRSTLVNRDRIAALEVEAGSWSVRLSSGERLSIGRSFLPILREHLGITTDRG